MAELTGLLQAVDAYMKSNGGGEKFLAKKIGQLFKSEKSPFSLERGSVLDNLKRTVQSFNDKLESLGSDGGIIDIFTQNMVGLNIETHIFRNKTQAAHRALDKLIKNINSFVVPTLPNINTPQPVSIQTSQAFFDKFIDIFSSRSVRKNFRNDPLTGKRHYDTGKAIDVNIIGMRKAFMGVFFRDLQKRFSSESILSEPNSEDKRHRIHSMNVHVQSLSDDVLEKIRKRINLNHDDKVKSYKKSDSENGIISKLWGWFKTAMYITGGLFLLGKGKQFLDNTALGKNIKVIFDKMTSGISRWLTKYLDSGDIGNTFASGIAIISDTFSFIWNSIATFFHRNEKSIQKNFDTVKDTIWNKVLYPIFSSIKNFIQETNWIEILKNVGDFMWSHILKPYFSSIEKSLEQGDFMGATTKIILGFGAALIPFSSGLGTITEAIGAISFNPLSSALIALGGSFAFLISETNKSISIVDQYKNRTNQDIIHINKEYKMLETQASMHKQQLDDLRKGITGDDEISRALKIRIHILENKILDIRKKTDSDILSEKKMMSSEGWLASQLNATWHQNKTNAIQRESSEKIEKFLPELSSAYKKLKTVEDKKKKVDDAIIVQPHSKDQILMAKTGGPIDLALKKMIEKIEEEQKILVQGFAMLVDATLSGAGQVSQTVAATAGASSSGSISSNRNPVADFRSKALGRIRQ